MKTFSQGIHPEYNKEKTRNKAIEELPAPKAVIIPLHQHTGATCEPLVKVGDEVVEGQKIGDTKKFISAPVHASISGKVKKIDKMLHPCGMEILSIVIEAGDGLDSRQQTADSRALEGLEKEEIRRIVREAGIVGLGGAAFPTSVKLTPPENKPIDTILINGCECEPYITADHRIMLEQAKEVVAGAEAIAKATNARSIVIGVEDNKLDAVEALSQAANGAVKIVVLETKYPQGGEKMMVKAILNREVPTKGLPLDVGVVVCNVGTAVAVHRAVTAGQALTKRVVTVAGSGVKEPKNLLVRIGTPFKVLLEYCGGLTADAAKVIAGGPMMGAAQVSVDVPVVKATSCLLVMNKKEAEQGKLYPCVKCAGCVEYCPMSLVPSRLAAFAEHGRYGEFEEWGGQDCIECGCCTYVCPSNIPIVHWIKLAKLKLRQMK